MGVNKKLKAMSDEMIDGIVVSAVTVVAIVAQAFLRPRVKSKLERALLAVAIGLVAGIVAAVVLYLSL